MEELLKRKQDESQNEYIARIYKNKVELNLTNKMCMEVINAELNKDYAESSLRSVAYPFTEGYELGFERALSQREASESNSIIEELEQKKEEIIKEKIKLQDQRREFHKTYRPEARFENILSVIREEIQRLNEYRPLTPTYNIEKNDGKKHAVLLASDWHLYAFFKNRFGEYNSELAKKRIEDLLNKTIKYCQLHEVDTLHLEILGDNMSGGIHWGSKVESEEDSISQIMKLSEIMSDFTSKLADKIQNVKVYSVIGNHSRLNMSKTDNQKGENLERIVPWFMETRLKKYKNIEICTEANVDDGIILFDVLNTKIVGLHGDLDKITSVVDDMIKMLKVIPDEINMGHYHHHYEKEEYDIEVCINGSLQGTDTYASNIRKSGRPMQKLRIYNEEGLLCSYKIKL